MADPYDSTEMMMEEVSPSETVEHTKAKEVEIASITEDPEEETVEEIEEVEVATKVGLEEVLVLDQEVRKAILRRKGIDQVTQNRHAYCLLTE